MKLLFVFDKLFLCWELIIVGIPLGIFLKMIIFWIKKKLNKKGKEQNVIKDSQNSNIMKNSPTITDSPNARIACHYHFY